ncbi:hypothetical protein EV421DRAFT_1914038 [Armillaria borealis]|uniref:Secreted protein n=1 Tax=Armillaria borealis TaxID=47425 RepID=A0AA39MDS6_9AGAR|nr:hypothetical protein EV421DRAFT_1914038 [Armillaria borealis]
MFFRILTLLTLVSVAITNTLVDRRNFSGLCDAFDAMVTMAGKVQVACTTYQAETTDGNLMARLPNLFTMAEALISEIKSGDDACPSSVVSVADGQIMVDKVKSLMTPIQLVCQCIVQLKTIFTKDGVFILDQVITFIKEADAASKSLMNKVVLCTPDSYQESMGVMRIQINADFETIFQEYGI